MEVFGNINRHDGLKEKLMLHGKRKEDALADDNDRLSWTVCRFINTSNKSLSKLDITWTEDREAWKSLIVDVCAMPDT
ncbi:hypothetical protein ElyMa_000330000 [Elysia marginata]|uniref:Uncharacterized protein n=1 Tax=Elysia marginata TaxID=1093978 RepID=A0AAV4FCI0_9GAST|nr:hypothetical protein ElyMa_000330000 [Elysia marginata]